jgi:porphobilinogen synthase
MPFPTHRLRRLRATESLRGLVRETHLHPGQFILPLFVCPGEGVRREIGAMPGNYQLSIDELVKECAEVHSLGIGGVILFGLPETKDEMASGAYDEDGIVQRAIRAIRREVPRLLVITDVCNCEYTSHGHCGYVKDGEVDNDHDPGWLAKSAVSHARAGADMVAPSDMMDGRVAAIRRALDAAGFPARFPSLPTPPSSLRSFTARSARPPIPRRSSATGAATRWIRPTAARPCARSRSISKRAPT